MPDLLLWRVLAPATSDLHADERSASSATAPSVAHASTTGTPQPLSDPTVTLESSSVTESLSPPERTTDTRPQSREARAAASWPDLRLPPGSSVEVRLVEVKGPRDRLSEKQHVWLRILLAAGAEAAVCKVTEPPVQIASKRAAKNGSK